MIPRAALNAWSQRAPWPNPLDVEQDLVLSRMIVEIANHPLLGRELAFRGGTSLHKLCIPTPWRYSNDLDYVRTTTGPIHNIMAAVRDVAESVGLTEARYEIKPELVNMKFDADPTDAIGRIRVKVEFNVRETVPAFGYVFREYEVRNPWFVGSADVLTFELEELLGTKLRALHQRRRGRDLFDLWLGLSHLGAAPDRVIVAFNHYLERSGVRIAPSAFDVTLARKLQHAGFRSDLDALLTAEPDGWSPDAGAALVREVLLPLMS